MKNQKLKLFRNTLSIGIAASLIACGGGGGGGSSGSTPQSSGQTLSGTVAMGAPVANATINVVDSRGVTVGTGSADASGAYSITVSANASSPLVIKASGIVGDSSYNLYAATSTIGTANVNQVSTAMAATLANSGNPGDIYNNAASLNISPQSIQLLDAAYVQAFSNLLTGVSNTTSFTNSIFTNGLDGVLDNIKIQIKPSGDILLATTSNLASDDLATNSTNTNQLQAINLPKGQTPNSSVASRLTATIPKLTISDLEGLRSKLEACFAVALASRGTPTNPGAQCADSNFVVSSDPNVPDGYKHSGFRWNNSNWNNISTNPTSAVNNLNYGNFGYLLVNSTFSNAIFMKPKIIRPLDASGNSWIVQFPIQLASGEVTSLGDAAGNKYLVVKKIPGLISGGDSGFRFIGDQRDYLAMVFPTVQKYITQSGINYQTGLNIVIKKKSSTDSLNRQAVLANIKGKGLPPGGIYMAQNDAGCGTAAAATLGIFFLNQTLFGGSTMNEVTLNSPIGSPDWATLQASGTCAVVFRMSETANESGPVALRSWGSDGTVLSGANGGFNYQGTTTPSGQWLTDSDLSSIEMGEPYSIKIWLSDGSTVNYVNRLPTSMLSLTESINYPDYPEFTAATKSSFFNFAGGASNFQASITPNTNIYTFQIGIWWNNVINSSITNVPPSVSLTNISCSGTCNTASNWNPGSAFMKAFARTVDSLAVSAVYWNY